LELILRACFFLLTDRTVALAAGSRYLTEVDLDFDRVLRESGKFSDIHVFRVDAQVGERGVGESFPSPLSSSNADRLGSDHFFLPDPETDQAGRLSRLMSNCGFHQWMQVLAGGAPEESLRMGVGVSCIFVFFPSASRRIEIHLSPLGRFTPTRSTPS